MPTKSQKKKPTPKKPAPSFDQILDAAIERHFKVSDDDIYDIADKLCYQTEFRNLLKDRVRKNLAARKAV